MNNENPQFFTQDQVLSLLNIAPSTLDSLKSDYMILAVQQNEGSVIYPKFQFTSHGLNAPLASIISCFKKSNAQGWEILHWFLSPNSYIEGSTPLAYYLETQDLQTVLTIASVSNDLEMMG